MRRHRGAVALAVAMLAVLTLLPVRPAGAITLFYIRGTVRDAIGRPLAGATVSDGVNPPVTTAADGTYALPESNTGTYYVTASRTDMDPAPAARVNATLPVDVSPVDFSLLYQMSPPSVGPMSSSGGSVSRTLNITTKAPQPGVPGTAGASCVEVGDSRTAQTSAATYVSSANGTATWTWTLSVPQGTAENIYSLTFVAKDCSTGTALTGSAGRSYTVDNTAPRLAVRDILPLDFGNTIFTAQRVMGRVYDSGGSGINVSQSSIVLEDVTAGTSSTITGSSLSYVNGYLRTPQRTLVDGHVYRVTVTAKDNAGNSSTVAQAPAADGGGFLVTHFAAQPTLGNIPLTDCAVAPGSTALTTKVTCSNVPLHLDATAAVVGGSRTGPQTGYVDQRISLATARVTNSSLRAAGLSVAAYKENDAAWAPKTRSQRFDVPSAVSEDYTATVQQHDSHLSEATLTVEVTGQWGDAQIFMDPVATTASVAASSCQDPSASSAAVACVPDPVSSRYLVWFKPSVTDVQAAAAAEAAAAGGVVDDVYSDGFRLTAPWRGVAGLVSDGRNRGLERFNLPVGDVNATDAARLVRNYLARGNVLDAAPKLQSATVGSPVLAPSASGDGTGVWIVPLIDADGLTAGYATTSNRYDGVPMIRVAHGDPFVRAAERRAEVEAATSKGVVGQMYQHVDFLTEGVRFTLDDGSVVHAELTSEPLDLDVLGYSPKGYKPAPGGDTALEFQDEWGNYLNRPARSGSSSSSCWGWQLGFCPAPKTPTRNYVPDSEGNFPNYEWHRGCTPTAAAMMEAYYSRHGRPTLMSEGDYQRAMLDPYGPVVQRFIDGIGDAMGTFTDGSGGTPWNNIRQYHDWEVARGVNRGNNELTWAGNGSYDQTIKPAINAGKPMVTSFSGWDVRTKTPAPGYGGMNDIAHSTVTFGYYIDTDDKKYLIMHTDAVVDGDAIVRYDKSLFDYGQFNWPDK